MKYGEAESITNIFWADAKMIIDYASFGDVVAFDTTFCTNKENRSFGVFVGFKHFRKPLFLELPYCTMKQLNLLHGCLKPFYKLMIISILKLCLQIRMVLWELLLKV